MSIKKSKTTAVVSWDEELANLATQAATSEEGNRSGGNYLSTRGGSFSYKDNDIGSTIEVVVVDHILENHLYDGRYDPDVPQTPICFSYGRTTSEMEPHELSLDKQHSDCSSCPHNQFGSSNTGKGKACKNVRRLALILSESMDEVESTEVVFLKLPVTSVKAWGSYVQQMAEVLKRPPLGVVTEISIVSDPKTQYRIQFKLIEKISEPEVIRALIDKRGTIQEQLLKPYTQPEERPVASKKIGKAPIKRKF